MKPTEEIKIPSLGTFKYDSEVGLYFRVMENGEPFGLGYSYTELEEVLQ